MEEVQSVVLEIHQLEPQEEPCAYANFYFQPINFLSTAIKLSILYMKIVNK